MYQIETDISIYVCICDSVFIYMYVYYICIIQEFTINIYLSRFKCCVREIRKKERERERHQQYKPVILTQ